MPRIALCMIVRDEEALLPGCLASVKGCVDDVIVVDTGSRDGTPEVARRAGARVFEHAWTDDFAEARNAALRRARAEWVLVLDADERLAPGSAGRLRGAIARATFDCGMLRLHDAARVDADPRAVLSGEDRISEVQLVPRLLRRTDGLEFVDPIHENVMPWLRRRGMRVAGVDVDIIHLGATASVVEAKGKIERNVRMLEARVARDPGDAAALGYLAHEYIRSGRTERAWEVADQGWNLAVPAGGATLSIHRLATARAFLLLGRRAYASARDTVRLAAEIEGENPDFTFLAAYATEHEAAGATGEPRRRLLLEAQAGYEACLAYGSRVFAQSFVKGARSWYGALRLGTVTLLLGESARALRCFDDALRLRPGEPLAALGRVEALLASGDLPHALQDVSPLLGVDPDGWTLAGLVAEALGKEGDARLFAKHALTRAQSGFSSPHRRAQLRELVLRLNVGEAASGSAPGAPPP